METRAKATTDHERIREWAERRGGEPATVKTTRSKGEAGILRIDFPGFSGKGSLEPISWDEWFEKFDENNLQFLYQDKTKGGQPSRFFKLVSKQSARATQQPRSKRLRSQAGSRSRSSRKAAPAARSRSRGQVRGRASSRSAKR
jgi:hypothetical protein